VPFTAMAGACGRASACFWPFFAGFCDISAITRLGGSRPGAELALRRGQVIGGQVLGRDKARPGLGPWPPRTGAQANPLRRAKKTVTIIDGSRSGNRAATTVVIGKRGAPEHRGGKVAPRGDKTQGRQGPRAIFGRLCPKMGPASTRSLLDKNPATA